MELSRPCYLVQLPLEPVGVDESSGGFVLGGVSPFTGFLRQQPLQSGCSHCLSTISMERIAATEAYPTSNLNRTEFPPSRRLQPSYPKEPAR